MQTNNQILSNLSAAAGVYIAAAEAERGYQVESLRMIAGTPMLVEFHHPGGVDRLVAAGADGDALARAVGDAGEVGLNTLSLDVRRGMADLMANGSQLAVTFDPVFVSADVALGTGDTFKSLATLISGDVH